MWAVGATDCHIEATSSPNVLLLDTGLRVQSNTVLPRGRVCLLLPEGILGILASPTCTTPASDFSSLIPNFAQSAQPPTAALAPSQKQLRKWIQGSSVCACVFVYVCVHACVCVRVCACMRVCVCTLAHVIWRVSGLPARPLFGGRHSTHHHCFCFCLPTTGSVAKHSSPVAGPTYV